jgi:hypothetical protein
VPHGDPSTPPLCANHKKSLPSADNATTCTKDVEDESQAPLCAAAHLDGQAGGVAAHGLRLVAHQHLRGVREPSLALPRRSAAAVLWLMAAQGQPHGRVPAITCTCLAMCLAIHKHMFIHTYMYMCVAICLAMSRCIAWPITCTLPPGSRVPEPGSAEKYGADLTICDDQGPA